ncbi:hypothetical protein [Mesorhizobium sp. M1322]|uniref:hypothetical protein n=1 Tax=Mesorhizobium sp. M1322 TaxID=2957081 RepID=UPI00333CD7BA
MNKEIQKQEIIRAIRSIAASSGGVPPERKGSYRKPGLPITLGEIVFGESGVTPYPKQVSRLLNGSPGTTTAKFFSKSAILRSVSEHFPNLAT